MVLCNLTDICFVHLSDSKGRETFFLHISILCTLDLNVSVEIQKSSNQKQNHAIFKMEVKWHI